ncbi:MAG: putative heme-binding protein [Planctomycetota bacterium]|nr:putative heme-binding protein [Planctomycetota bacterium]
MVRLNRFFQAGTLGLFALGVALGSSLARGQAPPTPKETPAEATKRLFSRDNLIAWCIVPFDSKKRAPEERAAMLEKLGFKHFAYDWRGEHIPTFDAEVDSLKKHGVGLDAWWVAPGELNRESKIILDVLKRHKVKAQLWVLLDFGGDKVKADEQARRVKSAADKLEPLSKEADAIGCSLALYNHGGWFGEPENQIEIVELLKSRGVANVGMVYNLHHGHDHLDRFPALLAKMKPYLVCLNLNGMIPNGEKLGKKILPLGQGTLDLGLLKIIRDSGYRGPIGILGHTQDDAEERLKDNLDGLDWLVPQLDGATPGPKPKPRTMAALEPDPQALAVDALLAAARAAGNSARGAEVFASTKFGCLTCHKVGAQGGAVGPELSAAGNCMTAEHIAESVLFPAKMIREGYAATIVSTHEGKVVQGYKQSETAKELVLRDAATGNAVNILKTAIDERKEQGTLMPEGLSSAMTDAERRDLIRFLIDLGRDENLSADALLRHAHEPAKFSFERDPLHPELWPNWQHRVNRNRLYDYYAKEAEYFRTQPNLPSLLPAFPGLDGGKDGHWGNQNETVWTDGRWNEADLGSLLSGVFRGNGVTVNKGVCVRLGDRGEMAACFNPETLCYEAVWQGGFVRFSSTRHGFMDGLLMAGTALPRPEGSKPDKPFRYHGYFRHGSRIVFSYRIGDVEILDAPWVEGGKFTRVVGPAKDHPLASLTKGGPARWPQILETKGELGGARPYAVDTIAVPFENPWKAPMFFGDHAFLADGSALLTTMQGDVWRVSGLDDSLNHVKWKRFATGLHHALGIVVADGAIYVLGRDQITRLHDLDGNGEADFHECVSNAFTTSQAGHDFICGLQRDSAGNFYASSGPQGLIKIHPDGKTVDVVATGFRNPDGVGLSPDGVLTVPCSEGEWTPTSMICEIRPGGFYGYTGPKNGNVPDLPMVYLPRGLDNSSGSQVTVPDDRWGPFKGQMIHTSFGAGTHFLVLREQVDGQPQGAVVPLPGDFLSGVHRGRFSPKDGQLYVSGMSGWGSYTRDDGCFQRVRYTGDPVQLPVAFHAHENGVLVSFSAAVDRSVAEQIKNQFVQVWNYRYGSAYGSPELSTTHPGTAGHDPLTIRSIHVLDDGKTVFLELPEIQPVNQIHLRLRVNTGEPRDVFGTIHKLAAPFTGFAGYRPLATPKVIAAHPILADLAKSKDVVPNRWRTAIPNARLITIEAGKNLSFSPRMLNIRAGEPIKLMFMNPDVVPHNWALIKPGTLPNVGDLANKIIADPDAASRHYIPKTDDVLLYADIVEPGRQFSISFHAPKEKGRYPFLCTFPGHWMIMNGLLIVE